MSIYTIFPCLIRECEKNDDLITYRTVLMKFLSGESKVAKDKKGYVIDVYGGLPDKNGIISNWLAMMSANPCRFENILVDLEDMESEEEKFIKLCKETKGTHKMIVYSVMGLCGDFNKYETIEKNNKYYLRVDEKNEIELFDKDEAASELGDEKEVPPIFYFDSSINESVIAGKNVIGSNNKKKSLNSLILKIFDKQHGKSKNC